VVPGVDCCDGDSYSARSQWVRDTSNLQSFFGQGLACDFFWSCDDMVARVEMLLMGVTELMQGETAYHGSLKAQALLDWCPADLAHPSIRRPMCCASTLLGRRVDLTMYGELPHLRPVSVFADCSTTTLWPCYPRACKRQQRALVHISVLSRIAR
jgi:hypothetical protein